MIKHEAYYCIDDVGYKKLKVSNDQELLKSQSNCCEIIKIFSCSAPAEHEILTFKKSEIAKINRMIWFCLPKPGISPACICLTINNCLHFNICEQDRF